VSVSMHQNSNHRSHDLLPDYSVTQTRICYSARFPMLDSPQS
jgi:hypothetical protein